MTPDVAADLIKESIVLVIKVISVLAIPSLLAGLFVSIMQAATQINEQSLSTLPRLIITLLTFALTTQWIIQEINDFFLMLMNRLPTIIAF